MTTQYEVTGLREKNSTAYHILTGHRLDPSRIVSQPISEDGYHERGRPGEPGEFLPWPKGFRFERWLELARRTPGVVVRELS